eukprot:15438204-Alexandrium_andersonii.AAC.1
MAPLAARRVAVRAVGRSGGPARVVGSAAWPRELCDGSVARRISGVRAATQAKPTGLQAEKVE